MDRLTLTQNERLNSKVRKSVFYHALHKMSIDWLKWFLAQSDCKVLSSSILCKETNSVSDFLHRDSYQRNIASKTTSGSWV